MITVRQVEWIFDRARDFLVYWVENPPTDEEGWQRLMEQAHDLMKRGREHPLLLVVMVGVLGCIGAEEKKNSP